MVYCYDDYDDGGYDDENDGLIICISDSNDDHNVVVVKITTEIS